MSSTSTPTPGGIGSTGSTFGSGASDTSKSTDKTVDKTAEEKKEAENKASDIKKSEGSTTDNADGTNTVGTNAGDKKEGDPHTGRSVSQENRTTEDEAEEADRSSTRNEYSLNTTRDPSKGGTQAVDLDDAAATQELHKRGVGAAIGEGHEVDPRTGPTEGLLLIESRDGVKAVKKGVRFLAGFLHNPNTDDKYYRRTHLRSLTDGTMVRRGLSMDYWANHSDTRPPIAERSENGYVIIEGIEGDIHEEALYG